MTSCAGWYQSGTNRLATNQVRKVAVTTMARESLVHRNIAPLPRRLKNSAKSVAVGITGTQSMVRERMKTTIRMTVTGYNTVTGYRTDELRTSFATPKAAVSDRAIMPTIMARCLRRMPEPRFSGG